jgi:two-component system, cell cycle response regulator
MRSGDLRQLVATVAETLVATLGIVAVAFFRGLSSRDRGGLVAIDPMRWISVAGDNHHIFNSESRDRIEVLPNCPNQDTARGPRVLLAEDNTVVQLVVQKWLVRWGYDVVAAADGREAWQVLCRKSGPKLVILDWSLPVFDGIELCRKLREGRRAYYPYILMITARSHKADVAHALEAGADDYLAKPFDAAELKARLAVANRILHLQDDLIAAREELRVQATRDALTGLFNRAAFEDLFSRELDRAARSLTPTGLLMLDLDHFKILNDTNGHPAGDKVLRETARRLKGQVRSYDIVGRLGGEEFCIVLPNCSESEVRARAEAIRLAIANEPVRNGHARIPVTASVGALSALPDEGLSTSELVAVADVALYRAKSEGRNTVVFCSARWPHLPDEGETPASRCGGCGLGAKKLCLGQRSYVEYLPNKDLVAD